uniref:GIY-YIG domain-containing protein n=1 Tax=Panagrolaimus superbus TaxID=310955 RepID=A0A914ZGJ3_9BILA
MIAKRTNLLEVRLLLEVGKNIELIVRKYLISRCYEQTPQSSNQQPIEQFDVTSKPIGERRKTEESGYGSCESESENVEESDDENNSDDTNDDEVDEGEEELISPIQIQAAKYFHQIPNYGPGTPMHTLLNEINTGIYFIYGLFLKDADGNIDTPFYIGVSGNPYLRFYQHHTHSASETLRQFKEANKNNIVMRILYGGSMENCLFLETLFIKFDKLLNYNLKNAQSGESRTPPLFECNAVTGLDNLIQYVVENGVNVTPGRTKTAPTTIEPFFKISPDYPMEFKALMEEIVQMDHYLYVLTIIDEHERIIKIFYIGITYSLEFRLYSHFLHCKKSNSPYCATLNKNLANVRIITFGKTKSRTTYNTNTNTGFLCLTKTVDGDFVGIIRDDYGKAVTTTTKPFPFVPKSDVEDLLNFRRTRYQSYDILATDLEDHDDSDACSEASVSPET